ncbi:MAG: nuclear transport factor 2 family protein [Gemmatimonadota bacterium]
MRQSRGWGWMAIAVWALVAAPVSAQDAEASVRTVVEEFVAAWKAGDSQRLAGLMAPAGTVVWVSDTASGTTVESMTFEELLRNRRPQERYELEDMHNLHIVDDQLATVDVEIRIATGTYHDHYVLYRVGQEWLIANKAFVLRRH